MNPGYLRGNTLSSARLTWTLKELVTGAPPVRDRETVADVERKPEWSVQDA